MGDLRRVEEKLEYVDGEKNRDLSQAFTDEMAIARMRGIINAEIIIEREKYRDIMQARNIEAEIKAQLLRQHSSFIYSGQFKGNKLVVKAGTTVRERLREQIELLISALRLTEKEYEREKQPILKNQRDLLAKALTAAEIELKLAEIELNFLRR